MVGYIDLYLLPVPKANIEPYKEQALSFGTIAKEYGALSYREFLADDIYPDENPGFRDAVRLGENELLTCAVMEFHSRSHRDDVMDSMMKDPRIETMVNGPELANMNLMHYGGFETFVNVN